jgi:predicted metal-dependent phosphotriesterase family hydrolase
MFSRNPEESNEAKSIFADVWRLILLPILGGFIAALMSKGISTKDISLMMKTNPVRALGLQ